MNLTVTCKETDSTFKLTVECNMPKIDTEKFRMVCWLIGIFLVGSGFIKFFSLIV